MITNSKVINELRRLTLRHKGILKPEIVVEAARNDKSALHSWFCWDDSAAAHRYRVWQARALLKVVVEYQSVNGDERPICVFQSLTTDRGGGGYRETSVVMLDKGMRRQLLADALGDLQRFELRYQQLRELADVFAAARNVRRKLERRAA
jgi:hypothetical protein